jgi:O-antigen ligase
VIALKWAIFAVALLASQPAARWIRDRPAVRLALWALVGVLPFVPNLYMAVVFFPGRVGDTHGLEVAVIDWLALTLLLAARPTGHPLPYRFALFAYFLLVVVAIPQARWTVHAMGYAWKLGRMYLLFAAIWRGGCEDERVPAALLRGLTIALVSEGALATWQHFGQGIVQATGTFVHQNTLGMLVNLVVMVPIARILAGPTSLLTRLAPLAALLAGFFAVSRGTLLFLGAGTALVFVGSTLRGFTLRKAWFGALGIAAAIAIIPVAVVTIETRAAEQRLESMEVRTKLESAASLMLRDHPLGLGPNHFALELAMGGYGRRAGVGWRMWTALVHNVYWLTAAELGYAGLVALLVLFAAPLGTVLGRGRWRCAGRRGDVLLGLGVGLGTLYAHSLYEWAWRQHEVSYVYFMTVAMIPVLAYRTRPTFEPAGASAVRVSGARTAAGAPAG